MGGNALKHLNPKRLTTTELIEVFNDIYRQAAAAGLDVHLVPWVDAKTDHGDIDILFDHPVRPCREFLASRLNIAPGSWVENDTVLSTPYQLRGGGIAQVDFICLDDKSDRYFRRFFFSGGDLGLFLGRVASWHGLVLGMDGLRLRHDPTKPWSKDIRLTSDPRAALNLLGYDGTVPRFPNDEAIWEWVLSSEMAPPWIFRPDATDAENRSRDKQRKKVVEFQAWLDTRPPVRRDFHVYANRADRLNAIALAERVEGGIEYLLEEQEEEWTAIHEFTKALGMGAVRKAAPDMSDEEAGEIVRALQAYLPSKSERMEILNHGDWRGLVRQAEAFASLLVKIKRKDIV